MFSDIFLKFLSNIRKFGIEMFGRYYGVYIAEVYDNNDPEKRGRIWVKCPQVYGHENPLDIPVLPVFDRGRFNPPEIGDLVLIVFDSGDKRFPRYLGTYYTQDDGVQSIAEEFKTNPPYIRGFKTKYGHKIIFYDVPAVGPDKSRAGSDTNDDPRIEVETKKGLKIVLSDKDNEEAIRVIDNVNKNSIIMNKDGISIVDSNGNIIAMTNEGVRINGHYLVTDDFLSWMDKNKSQLVLGNMGSPAPINPVAMPDFQSGVSMKDKFKTDK